MMVDTKVPTIIFCAILDLEVGMWQDNTLCEAKKKSWQLSKGIWQERQQCRYPER